MNWEKESPIGLENYFNVIEEKHIRWGQIAMLSADKIIHTRLNNPL